MYPGWRPHEPDENYTRENSALAEALRMAQRLLGWAMVHLPKRRSATLLLAACLLLAESPWATGLPDARGELEIKGQRRLPSVARVMAKRQADVSPAPRAGLAPGRHQVARLDRYEHLLRYYSSLAWGDSDRRISSNYLRALVLTESGGRADAVSPVGARGLTQLMPATARAAARRLAADGRDYLYVDKAQLREFNESDLFDPAINLLLASYINTMHINRFEQRYDLLAAAWNAGPGAVRRYGNTTPPYRETRQHVSRVLGYMRWYESNAWG